jgi:hypothetical protein
MFSLLSSMVSLLFIYDKLYLKYMFWFHKVMLLLLLYVVLIEVLSKMFSLLRNSKNKTFLLQEVEADKQNAAKLNALVQITGPTEDWNIGGGSPPHSHGIVRGGCPEQETVKQNNSSSNSSAKCYTFGEVRKKQQGCIQHHAEVGFMCERYPSWLK